jgi:hypothetical protein
VLERNKRSAMRGVPADGTLATRDCPRPKEEARRLFPHVTPVLQSEDWLQSPSIAFPSSPRSEQLTQCRAPKESVPATLVRWWSSQTPNLILSYLRFGLSVQLRRPKDQRAPSRLACSDYAALTGSITCGRPNSDLPSVATCGGHLSRYRVQITRAVDGTPS